MTGPVLRVLGLLGAGALTAFAAEPIRIGEIEPLTGKALYQHLTRVEEYLQIKNRFKRRLQDPEITRFILDYFSKHLAPGFSNLQVKRLFAQESFVTDIASRLLERDYKVEILQDEEHGCFNLRIGNGSPSGWTLQ